MYAQDPFSVYAWLRENDPVYWDEKNEIWGVSRHADLLAVEKNTDLYSSASGSRPSRRVTVHAKRITIPCLKRLEPQEVPWIDTPGQSRRLVSL